MNDHDPASLGDSLDDSFAALLDMDRVASEAEAYHIRERIRFDALLDRHEVNTPVRFSRDNDPVRLEELQADMHAIVTSMFHDVGIYDQPTIDNEIALHIALIISRDITFISKAMMTSLLNDSSIEAMEVDSVQAKAIKAQIIAEVMWKYSVGFDSSWVRFLNEAVHGGQVDETDAQAAMLAVIEKEVNQKARSQQWHDVIYRVMHAQGITDREPADIAALTLSILPLLVVSNAGELESQIAYVAAEQRLPISDIKAIVGALKEFLSNDTGR